MSTATEGRRREHKVRDHMRDAGWIPIMRAAGSKGPADLLLAHPEHGAALVQVGTAGKNIGPEERLRFVVAAEMCGALAVCARVTPRVGIRYSLVTADSASSWEDWSP